MSGLGFSAMGESVFISLVAFTVVIGVLFLLSLVIYGMKAFSGTKKKGTAARIAKVEPPVVTGGEQPASLPKTAIDPQIVAVITAAIAASLDKPFTISSITPASCSTLNWRMTGRVHNLTRGSLRDPWKQ